MCPIRRRQKTLPHSSFPASASPSSSAPSQHSSCLHVSVISFFFMYHLQPLFNHFSHFLLIFEYMSANYFLFPSVSKETWRETPSVHGCLCMTILRSFLMSSSTYLLSHIICLRRSHSFFLLFWQRTDFYLRRSWKC